MTRPASGDGNASCPSVSSPSASRTPLVRLDNVTVTLGGNRIFHRLSLSLYAGEHAAVIGRNGAGKSTLLRLLHGDVRPDQAGAEGEDPGRVFWRFQDGEESSVLCAREHVRLVSDARQRDYARHGWNVTGREILLSGLDNAVMLYGETTERQARRAVHLAGEAGAEELLEKRAGAMSQGQLRLCLILRALMSRPCMLLLDEPFDGLDTRARAAVFRAVALAAEKGATLLVSAHRREDVPPLTRVCLWLRRGRVVRLPLEDAAKELLTESEGADKAAVPGGTTEAVSAHETMRLEAGGNSAGAGILEQDVDRAVRLADTARGEGAEPDFVRRLRALAPGAELLRLSHVDVYRERAAVLRDINWTIRAGEQWIVTGSNGAGKSTLLGLLLGEEFAAWGGELFWCGRPRPGLEELRHGLGHVSDRLLNACDEDMSAEDAVISGLRGSLGLYGEPDEREQDLARFWLERFALLAAKDRPLRALSSGMARRVLLARALAGSPPVLLLDEPCSGLDPRGRTLLLKALPLLAGRGVHCVFVSHHAQDAGDLFTHELHLQNGRVAYAGTRR